MTTMARPVSSSIVLGMLGSYSSYVSHSNPQYMLVAIGW